MNIVLKDVSVYAGKKSVLQQVNGQFPSGKISVISGDNGCGKSTLLHAIAGLPLPSAGMVEYDGINIAGWSPQKLARKRAIVRQNPVLPDKIIVEDLLYLARYSFDRSREHDRQAVEQALAEMDCLEFRSRELGTLSGGERRRAAMALALAQTPELLLLDEIEANLDARSKNVLPLLLKKLQRERKLTIIMVMHDLDLALHCADNFYGMADGKITFSGDCHAPDFMEKLSVWNNGRYRFFTDENGLLRALPCFA